MVYITGDTHGSFNRLLVSELELSSENVLVILGDVGVNYYLDKTKEKILEKK